MSFTTSTGHFDQLILGAPFSLHGFPAPFRRRFPALPCGVIAVYPMQTVFRFSRCGAEFGNKKSPHNNLNLTIPSGMALVRVRYVAIRKLKTCSGSFGSRAGTLSKYVILNCWDRLPQKSSCVNKKFWKHATFVSLQENTRETLVKRENETARPVRYDVSNSFHFCSRHSTKRRPSALMQTAAFGFMPYSICQSLKILSSSLSMVPALANSSVSAWRIWWAVMPWSFAKPRM